MRQITVILLSISFITFSCNDNKNKHIPITQVIKTTVVKTEIKKQQTDKLIISSHAKTLAYGDTSWINTLYKDAFETTDTSAINGFERLLQKNRNNTYCCCPSRNYIISYFNNNKNYKSYFVEIVKDKDSILLYEYNFQYSFKIPKEHWDNLLKKSNKLIRKRLSSCDLNNSRKLFKYAKENKLTIAYSNSNSREWPYYDGEFKFTVSKYGKKLTKDEILDKIYTAYPETNYKIEFTDYYELCGSSDPKVDDCTTKHTVTISCNKDFYDKFNLYEPKSSYNKFCPDFYILGDSTHI